MRISTIPVVADDLRNAVRVSCIALRGLQNTEWEEIAPGLEWTRRDTIAHVIDAYAYCTLNLANRTDGASAPRILSVRQPASQNEIMDALPLWAEVLVQTASIAESENGRGFHRWGRPDGEGYLSMACVEILVHTYDVLRDKTGFEVLPALSDKIVARLFPWAAGDPRPWQALLWATGRVEMPNKESMSGRWAWHCDPLDEWNGELKVSGSR